MTNATGRGTADRNHLESFSYRIGELERRMDQPNVFGKVEEVDYEKRRLKVKTGEDRITGFIPWTSGFADSGAIDWQPPQKGAQVMVMQVSGDPAMGLAVTGIHYNDHPTFSTSDKMYGREYGDKTFVKYDQEEHKYHHKVMDDGTHLVECGDSSIEIKKDSIKIKTPNLEMEGTETIKEKTKKKDQEVTEEKKEEIKKLQENVEQKQQNTAKKPGGKTKSFFDTIERVGNTETVVANFEATSIGLIGGGPI